jgi:hypothetical protein
MVVTSWSDGRILWPRCRAADTPGGGSGLVVDAELTRAVRLNQVRREKRIELTSRSLGGSERDNEWARPATDGLLASERGGRMNAARNP